jgi:hypothetical protein
VELALVEGELFTLQDVAIAAAGLAGAAGDDGVQTTGLELLLKRGVDLAGGGEASGLLLLNRLALLGLLNNLALLLLATATDGLAVVSLVPLTERRSVDLDNGGLGQGVGADKLVVRRVVCIRQSAKAESRRKMGRQGRTCDHNDTSLAGAALRGPGEVARVKTERTVLVVATASADNVDALGTNTGVRRLATQLEGSLLPCTQLSEIVHFHVRITGSERMGSAPAAACSVVAQEERDKNKPPQKPSKRTFERPLCRGAFYVGGGGSRRGVEEEEVRTYGRNCTTIHVSNHR